MAYLVPRVLLLLLAMPLALDAYPRNVPDEDIETEREMIELIKILKKLKARDHDLRSDLYDNGKDDQRRQTSEKKGMFDETMKANEKSQSTESDEERLSEGDRSNDWKKENDGNYEKPTGRAPGGDGGGRTSKSRAHGRGHDMDHENVNPNSDIGNILLQFEVDIHGKQLRSKNVNAKDLDRVKGEEHDHHETPKTADLEDCEEVQPEGRTLTRRNFIRNFKWLWPGGIVPYEIATNAFTTQQEDIIQNALAEMKAKTCVDFQPRATADVSHDDYVYFDNIHGSGCWSYVGKISVGKQEIGLDDRYCINNPTILHEMCHAIGMQHEQSRNDRDKYVTMLWDNIIDGENNGNMVKSNTDDDNPYDYESILQYFLTDFAKTAGTYTMRFRDVDLEGLAGTSQELTFYDIKDITDAYSCTAKCGTDIPTCENGGFVDHYCTCLCPATLSGDDCSEVPTDAGCGGIIDVTSGPQEITSPNYPENYDVGAICTWLVKGPAGKLIELTVNELKLSYNSSNMNCYHWLEIRYNLIGQTGIMKCGDVTTNEVYTTTWFKNGTPNILYIQFNSAYADDKYPSKGFRLNAQAVKTGCASSPCIHGSCLDDPTLEFKCICDDLYYGVQCEKVTASGAFSCDFENPDDCLFVNDADGLDDFDWKRNQGGTPSGNTGPSKAYAGEYYMYAEVSFLAEGDTAVLLSDGILPVGEWCLSFMYHMYGDTPGKFEVFGEKDHEVWWSSSENVGNQWNNVSIQLPLGTDQKIGLRATVGSSFRGDIAIDDLHLQACIQERCDFETGNECFLSQSQTDDFDWITDQVDETPSSKTGPSSAQDGTHYAFIESSLQNRNDKATLTSITTFPAGEYCLVFFYHMYGKKMGGLVVSTLEDSSGEEHIVFLKTGDQGQQWNQGVVSLHESENVKLLFTGIRGASYSSDIAIDNITLTSDRCACLSSPCLNGGTCAPYVSAREGYECTCPSGLSGRICEVVAAETELYCTFENNAVCFLQQAWGDSFDWTIREGPTTTADTGPSGAVEGTHYAYIETSGVITSGDVANFTTYPMSFEEGDRCLSFHYSMYGLTIGQLAVYNGDTLIFRDTGNKGNHWFYIEIDVVNLSGSSQLIISASVDQDHEFGDIAIDDVSLTPGLC